MIIICYIIATIFLSLPSTVWNESRNNAAPFLEMTLHKQNSGQIN